MDTRESLIRKIVWVSVISNFILTIIKLIVGWLGHSGAVFTDGIHSGADVFASIIVLTVIKIANKPADDEHPYGHGKAEVIVSGMIGILLLFISLYIIFEGISGFFHSTPSPNVLTMWVAVISCGLKEFLYKVSFKFAKEHNSKAIEAIAYDHKADIVASIAAAIGVAISIIGSKFHMHFLLYGDKIASIIVACLIFNISRAMLKEAFSILLERNIEVEILNEYISMISSFPDVKRIDKVRAREHGHYVLVDIRISIDYKKSIKEGHDLSREIKQLLMNEYDNINEVLIHLNPYYPYNIKNKTTDNH